MGQRQRRSPSLLVVKCAQQTVDNFVNSLAAMATKCEASVLPQIPILPFPTPKVAPKKPYCKIKLPGTSLKGFYDINAINIHTNTH